MKSIRTRITRSGRHASFSLLVAAALGLCVPGAASAAQARADLLSSTESIQPGKPFRVALRLDIDPHWHTYWRNPGDAGLPTKIRWDLPEGFSAGPIEWPYPSRLPVDPLMNFGFEGEPWHLVTITPPADLEPGSEVTLSGKASWLVCKQICIPESEEVSLVLPVSDAAPAPSDSADGFATAETRLPAEADGWTIAAYADRGELILAAAPDDADHNPGDVEFYPYEKGVIIHSAPQRWSKTDSGYQMSVELDPDADSVAESIGGVLVTDRPWVRGGDRRAIEIDVPVVAGPPASTSATAGIPPVGPDDGAGESRGLLVTIVLGFIGGLILNLMPCVFPVVGIKIMGFVKQAGEERSRIKLHGVVYTLGVLVSFWILAGFLIAVRAGGAELGWGFQLQSPMFVFVLTAVLLAFALNLSGVFEVGLGLTGVGQGAASRSGLGGSLMSGVLATVVSTPCAAPFLAPALGAAMALEPVESLLVFTSIGLGLSAPYLILSMFPAWVERLPRPGPWMESFKQAMAFLLYATVAYLVWVLAAQLEDRKFLHVLIALVGIGLAGWVYGRWSGFDRSPRARWIARVVAVLLVAWSLWTGHRARLSSDISWEKWSPQRVTELVEEGRIVYVDFTARWCATCQANKEAVFLSSRVLDAFKAKDVATLKADWTNADPEITRELESFGRSAVPFNLVYKPGVDAPVELPELLTPGIVLDAIGD